MKSGTATCAPIGKAYGYSEKELKDIQTNKLDQAKDLRLSAVLKTGGFGVAAVVMGIPVIGILSLAYSGASLVLVSANVLAISVVGGSEPYWTKDTNPFYQFKQARVLEMEGILSETDLTVDDEKVLEVKQYLEEILN